MMWRVIAFLCVFAVLRTSAVAQNIDTPRNPFAHAETRVLPNGLKVWFVRTPGLADAAVSISTPYGFDQDPEGYRQLAHFTEHLMFSDRPLISELELKNAIDTKGGTNNALTTYDRTSFYAHVRKEHGLYALTWLHTLMTPPLLTPVIIERERTPVAVEVGARQPGLFEWITEKVVDVPWLRPKGYWRREYDIPDRSERHDTDWSGLQAIDSAVVRNFINRYYVPSRMTLTVIGDLPPDSVWSLIDKTFASLPSRTPPAPLPSPHDPARAQSSYDWDYGSNARLSYTFKRYATTPRANLVTTFLEYYLSRRLNDRLRFAQHKAAYGVTVFNLSRGKAAEFNILARVKAPELSFARAVIDSEIASLRDGTIPDSLFVHERDVMTSLIRTRFGSAAAIDAFVMRAMSSRDDFGDFPDLLTELSTMSRAEVVAGARELFTPTRELHFIHSIIPIPQAALVALTAVLLAVVIATMRTILLRPLPMASLRYVANIRRSTGYAALTTATLAIGLVIAMRLAIYPVQVLFVSVIMLIPTFAVQAFWFFLFGMIPVIILLLVRASIPSKVLVFEHGIAIKCAGYRSLYMQTGDIAEISQTTLRDLYDRIGWRGLLRTRVMAPAILGPALFLRSSSGKGWLFRSRNTEELMETLRHLT